MQEKFTPYLEQQFANKAIAEQYLVQQGNIVHKFHNLDPLSEESHQPVKGLIHKYYNRALIKVSYRCASHCRFCTRIRQIGTNEGDLNNDEIQNIINYIKQHPEIMDVILSGGDPFYSPKQTLSILEELEVIESVKVIRIGTRLPVHNPKSFEAGVIKKVLKKIVEIQQIKPLFILINFEHPDELTPETIRVIKQLKQTGATILSQTVFLKGINNNSNTLKRLFENLFWNGVLPYYIYRCDSVQGLEHFVCDINEEIQIMTELRKRLSGLAYPTYIVDVEGTGKIPIPLSFWSDTDISQCKDFNDKQIRL
ncbi:MAG: KamA family radical SAM protein [Opitutaceae bacterium]